MAETSTSTRPLTGIAFLIGAAFFWSVMSVCVKFVGERLPSQQIVWVRAIVTLGYSYLMLRWSGVTSIWGTQRRLLWLRGGLGFTALTCFFYALTKLPLADATVIHYTNPVFVALIAAVVLQEPLTAGEMGGAVTSLAGVALIAKPSFVFGDSAVGLNPLYVGIALLGAICAASAYVVVRKLRETEHPFVIVFYFPLVASISSAPTAVFADLQWPTGWEWLLLIVGVGVSAQLAQVFVTRGLHAVKAGRAMTVTYLQIVFAALWGWTFFGETVDFWSAIGGCLVVGGTLVAHSRRG